MTTKYKLHPSGALNQETGAYIPEDVGNHDWQEYQAWLDVGNTPEPYMNNEDIVKDAKDKKKAELSKKLDELRELGFEFPDASGERVQVREVDIINITGLTVRASLAGQLGGWPGNFTWTSRDNNPINISTAQDMLVMGEKAFATISGLLLSYRRKKDEIMALLTLEEVNNYDTDDNW